jgi:hypothetical protein
MFSILGSTDGETKTSTQVYSMPPGAEKIEPSGVNQTSSCAHNIIKFYYHTYHVSMDHIIASGFLRNLNNLASLGYPEPPPLMLERKSLVFDIPDFSVPVFINIVPITSVLIFEPVNGRLVHKFEEVFGYLHAWSGYSYNLNYSGDGMNAWARLDAKTITTISRRVVSLSSYHGEYAVIYRYFLYLFWLSPNNG